MEGGRLGQRERGVISLSPTPTREVREVGMEGGRLGQRERGGYLLPHSLQRERLGEGGREGGRNGRERKKGREMERDRQKEGREEWEGDREREREREKHFSPTHTHILPMQLSLDSLWSGDAATLP